MSKITHERIRNHFKNNFNANDVKYEDLRIITEYVSQQEKQEKLLTLYREKEKHEQEFPALNHIEYEDYQRIKTKIRELENE